MKNRKNHRAINPKLHVIHAAVGKFRLTFTPTDQKYTTSCGKTARRILAVFNKDVVTCHRCITVLKEENWYCENHGFIEDVHVNYDETCDTCGMSVA